jgi:hypothetical protein
MIATIVRLMNLLALGRAVRRPAAGRSALGLVLWRLLGARAALPLTAALFVLRALARHRARRALPGARPALTTKFRVS